MKKFSTMAYEKMSETFEGMNKDDIKKGFQDYLKKQPQKAQVVISMAIEALPSSTNWRWLFIGFWLLYILSCLSSIFLGYFAVPHIKMELTSIGYGMLGILASAFISDLYQLYKLERVVQVFLGVLIGVLVSLHWGIAYATGGPDYVGIAGSIALNVVVSVASAFWFEYAQIIYRERIRILPH